MDTMTSSYISNKRTNYKLLGYRKSQSVHHEKKATSLVRLLVSYEFILFISWKYNWSSFHNLLPPGKFFFSQQSPYTEWLAVQWEMGFCLAPKVCDKFWVRNVTLSQPSDKARILTPRFFQCWVFLLCYIVLSSFSIIYINLCHVAFSCILTGACRIFPKRFGCQ